MPKKKEECSVCTSLLKVCKKLGDRSYCKKMIKDLEDDEITDVEFDRKLRKHFGARKFNKEWDEEIGD